MKRSRGRPGKEVWWNGVRYKSITEMAKANGTTLSTASRTLIRLRENPDLGMFEIDGVKFESVKEASDEFGVDPSFIINCIKLKLFKSYPNRSIDDIL